MKSLKLLFASVLVLFSVTAQAGYPGKVVIVGKIKTVSEKTLTIQTEDGKVVVPRKSVNAKKIAIDAEVRAYVTPLALVQLNG